MYLPQLDWVDFTNWLASLRDSDVPESSQEKPLPRYSISKSPFSKYIEFKSDISNSSLFEGSNDSANLLARLSKKYSPVIAKLDFGFFGFSAIEIGLPFLSKFRGV